MSFEILPENYYRTCGDFIVQNNLYQEGGLCVFQQYTYAAVLRYKCNWYSIFYEARRPSEIRGKFGVLPLPAFILTIAPMQVFVAVLGALNLIIMRHMQKGIENLGIGTLIYHQLQIGCDIVAALVGVSPDFVNLRFYVNDIYHAFTGKNRSDTKLLQVKKRSQVQKFLQVKKRSLISYKSETENFNYRLP